MTQQMRSKVAVLQKSNGFKFRLSVLSRKNITNVHDREYVVRMILGFSVFSRTFVSRLIVHLLCASITNQTISSKLDKG